MKNGLNLKNKKLPMQYPPITSYSTYSNLLSVILNYKRSFDWFLNHYIQLYCRDEVIFNPDVNPIPIYPNCPYIYFQKINRDFVLNKWDCIVDFFIDSIKFNYYVFFTADQFFMPPATPYKRKHLLHKNFIYGYSMQDKIFNIADHFLQGKYSYEKVSFSQVEESFMNVDKVNKIDYLDKSILLILFKKAKYTFNINLVVTLLNDYLLSRNTVDGYEVRKFLSEKNTVYGMAVYEYLRNILKSLFKNNRRFDIRPFHALWDHKTAMLLRIKYMSTNKYLRNANQIYENYKEIEQQALIIRNMVLTAHMTKKKIIVEKIIEKLYQVEKKERNTIENMLNSIS